MLIISCFQKDLDSLLLGDTCETHWYLTSVAEARTHFRTLYLFNHFMPYPPSLLLSERSLRKVSCIQPSIYSVSHTSFCHVGLLFHRTSCSPGDFSCLLSTEIVRRLRFCHLLGIFHLSKFVPCGVLKSREVTGSSF